MGTATFGHIDRIVIGAPDTVDATNPIIDALEPFTIAFLGDTLDEGETFIITGSGPLGIPIPVLYDGVTVDGEIRFALLGNPLVPVGFLTNLTYVDGVVAPTFRDFSFPLVCFLPGTRIATPIGEVAVETLAIGDPVLTFDGRAVPVKWIGRQTISPMFGMREGRQPVRIAAGALGNNLPVRDLRLTADHALLIDNVLVQAGALVNGTTVRRIPPSELGERFVVYHIETENHEVVLAERTPAETFIDNIPRRLFDNYAEFESLYGDETPIVELDQPRAMSARQVPRAIRERLAAVARALGYGAEIAA